MNWLFTLLLGLVVAVGPFVGGLFDALPRFRVLGVVLLLCAAFHMLSKQPLVIPVAGIPVGLLCLLYIVRGAFAPASYLGALNASLIFLAAVALYFTVSAKLGQRAKSYFLCLCAVASGFSLALLGLYRRLEVGGVAGQVGQLDTGFGYANATAAWLVVCLTLALLLAVKPHSRIMGILLLATTPVMGAALLLTGSRGGWLSLAAALLLSLIVLRQPVRQLSLFMVMGGGSAAVAVAVLSVPSYHTLLLALAGSVLLAIPLVMFRKHSAIAAFAVAVAVTIVGVNYVQQELADNSYTLVNATAQPAWSFIDFRVPIDGAIREVVLRGSAQVAAANSPYGGHVSAHALHNEEIGARLATKNLGPDDVTLALNITLPDGAQGLLIRFSNHHPKSRATLRDLYIETPVGEIRLRNLWHALLPHTLANNMGRLTIEALKADGRVMMLSDGLKIFRRAPWLGSGGGAWLAMYSAVQSYYYGSTHAHSDPLEVLLDTGALGLVLFLAFGLCVLGASVKRGKTDHLAGATGVAFMAFLIHGAGEALLGFPAVMLGAFMLLGAGSFGSVVVPPSVRRLFVALFLAGGIIGLSFAAAERVAEESPALAVSLNPLSATHRVRLAESLPADDARLRGLYERAHRLEPNHPAYAAHLGGFHLRSFNFYPAVDTLMRAVLLQPLNIANYENAVFAAAEAATALHVVSPREAQALSERALSLYNRLQETRQSRLEADERLPPGFEVTPRLAVDVGRALAVLGRSEEALPYLHRVEGDTDGKLALAANTWLPTLAGMVYDPRDPVNLMPTAHSVVGDGIRGFTWWRMTRPVVDTAAWEGVAALRAEVTEAGWSGMGTSVFGPVTAGQMHTGSVYARRSRTGRMLLRLDWHSDTTSLGHSHGPVVEVGSGWQRLTVSGIAPANTTRVRLYAFNTDGQGGDVLWVDGWMFERGERASLWLPGGMRRVR